MREADMATFYVIPSRPQLGERFAGYLQKHFPGLNCPTAAWGELADSLVDAIHQSDVFVVYREELPEGEELTQALAEGFGAEPGDQVVEISLTPS
jgi:hypothetical protein